MPIAPLPTEGKTAYPLAESKNFWIPGSVFLKAALVLMTLVWSSSLAGRLPAISGSAARLMASRNLVFIGGLLDSLNTNMGYKSFLKKNSVLLLLQGLCWP